MKKIYLYIAAVLCITALLYSCSSDSLNSTSVIQDSSTEINQFDLWLEENYRAPYNISFKYKFEDIESDLSKDLVPADMDNSIIMAKLIKFLWLDAYVEAADVTFLRTYAPRVMMVVGSAGWNANGSYTVGTAEGGLKITLYLGNSLDQMFTITKINTEGDYTLDVDIDNLNYYYLHTIHHEFAHILHQTKNYPTEFNTISAGNYSPSGWTNRSDATAAQLGFISPYASSQTQEDFVELIAFYVTLSDEQWQAKLDLGGEEGAAIIEQKLLIVKSYMLDSWDIDLDELKSILQRKYNELYFVDWVNL